MNAQIDIPECRDVLLGKMLYAAVFTVLVPLFLWWLARQIHIPAPAFHAPLAGAVCAVLGLGLTAFSMVNLVVFGKGLPMNAYPPRLLVTRGAYALVPHPIYCGFVLLCLGISLISASAAGLWFVTPLAALACAALVWGYERPYLQQSFQGTARPWLGSGRKLDDTPCALFNRIGMMLSILIPWLVLYYAIKLLGPPHDAFTVLLPGESAWPVVTWIYPVYASAYVVIPLAFLVAPADAVKKLYFRGWVSLLIMTLLYLVLPVVAPPRPLPTMDSIWANMLVLDQQKAAPFTAAFPSYHVVWSILVAAALAARGRAWAWGSAIWAALVAYGCSATGMHSLLDVPAGALVGLALCTMEYIWDRLLFWAQKTANSFSFVRVRRVRIFSHASWSFAAGFAGLCVSGVLLGPQYLPGLFLVILCGIAGAGIWGQWIEGGTLSRPFGYFGSVIAVSGLVLVAFFMGKDVTPIVGAVAAAAPWVQALGRVRCLIQGCCHGKAVPFSCACGGATTGTITIDNPGSRVCSLSQLGGRAIYPTQLYSILGNIVIGLLLVRLQLLGSPAVFIAGMYCILSGLLRFVEEGYRGEAQTPHNWGLPVYQWLAVAMTLAGTVLCALHGQAPLPMSASLAQSWDMPGLLALLAWSAVCGMITALAYSVDFPESGRRFSRLAG